MKLTKNMTDEKAIIIVEGRIDTTTAPVLEEEIKGIIENITYLEIDFTNLEYISSAGLRVLLSTQKTMNKKGKLVLKNVNEEVMEVFEITGFVDILTIE